jgi:hypothetical protein
MQKKKQDVARVKLKKMLRLHGKLQKKLKEILLTTMIQIITMMGLGLDLV